MNEITRLRDLKIGARDMFTLPLDAIVTEDNFNPRNYRLPENRDHLDELKRSIAVLGVQVPLLVRFDTETRTAILVDGECRLRAARELAKEGHEIVGIPVIQMQGNNAADRVLTAITANTGKPLSQWEIGGAFRRLIAFGWTEKQVAEKTGYKERFVKQAIELSDAPDDVKYLLSEQAVTPSLALSEIRKRGAGASLVLKAHADAARAAGKKTAKKAKKPSAKAKLEPSTGGAPTVLGLLKKLFKGVEVKSLENEEYGLVDVNREAALALYRIVYPN